MPVPARASPCAAGESPLTVARPAMVRPSAWKSRLSARRSPTFRAVNRELSRISAVQAVWVFPASSPMASSSWALIACFDCSRKSPYCFCTAAILTYRPMSPARNRARPSGESAPARLDPGLWIALIIASSEPKATQPVPFVAYTVSPSSSTKDS